MGLLALGSAFTLIYGAIRYRNLALALLCLAMIVWPFLGAGLDALALYLGRQSGRDARGIFAWGPWNTPHFVTFIARVRVGIALVHSSLVLLASLATLRFLNARSRAERRIEAER